MPRETSCSPTFRSPRYLDDPSSPHPSDDKRTGLCWRHRHGQEDCREPGVHGSRSGHAARYEPPFYFFSWRLTLSPQAPGEGYSAKRADIWAMGISLYCFLTGRLPFTGASSFLIFEAIREQECAHRLLTAGTLTSLKLAFRTRPTWNPRVAISSARCSSVIRRSELRWQTFAFTHGSPQTASLRSRRVRKTAAGDGTAHTFCWLFRYLCCFWHAMIPH